MKYFNRISGRALQRKLEYSGFCSNLNWQLQYLSVTFNQYGLFGIEQKIINTPNDTIRNRAVREELMD